jgi:hypothetical protein
VTHSATLAAKPPSAAWRSLVLELVFSHSLLGRLTYRQDIQR